MGLGQRARLPRGALLRVATVRVLPDQKAVRLEVIKVAAEGCPAELTGVKVFKKGKSRKE